MPKRSSKPKRRRPTGPDLNQLASRIVEEATSPANGKNPAAVALGRLGGKKGGPARAQKLTAAERAEIAAKAARARWAKKRGS